MRKWRSIELFIGDYSVLIHVPENATHEEVQEIIKNTINLEIAHFGLKVIKV